MATNHIYDLGEECVRESDDSLARLGVQRVGYGRHLEAACRPYFTNAVGRRLGILAFCRATTNGENLATHLSPAVAPMVMATMPDAISETRSPCDALLVYLHWRAEHTHERVSDQIRVARHAVDCGADAVVGCHSHNIQSWAQYKGCWIFCGLGTFLFGDLTALPLQADGSLKPALYLQKPENRESLFVSTRIVDDQGPARIALKKGQPLAFGDNLQPHGKIGANLRLGWSQGSASSFG